VIDEDVPDDIVVNADTNNGDDNTPITGQTGQQVPLTIEIGNGGLLARDLWQVDLDGVVIFAEVPAGLQYVSDGSGVTNATFDVLGESWELLDASGACPDGSAGGTVCAFRIGSFTSDDSATLIFNTEIVDSQVVEEAGSIVLEAEMAAANLATGEIYRIDMTTSVAVQTPTGLPTTDEPEARWFSFLPFIGR